MRWLLSEGCIGLQKSLNCHGTKVGHFCVIDRAWSAVMSFGRAYLRRDCHLSKSSLSFLPYGSYYFGVFCFAILGQITAQDINFSQFNVMSSYYNPASTGYFDGNFRFVLINRNQWTNLTADPNRSFALSGDIKFDLGNHNFAKDFIAMRRLFSDRQDANLNWTRNEIGTQLAFHRDWTK